jgi:hypothetical protein
MPPTPQLPERTVTWLAQQHAHARTAIDSVWNKLTELERAGHHPDPLAALRSVLAEHQPTPAGRCRTCRRLTWRHLWRRRRFPCLVWHQIHIRLFGVFARGDRQDPAETPEQMTTPVNRRGPEP